MKVYGPESHMSSSAPRVRKTIVVKEQERISRTGSTCCRPHHRYRQCTHDEHRVQLAEQNRAGHVGF